MIQPNTPVYRLLTWVAVGLGIVVIGVTVYQYVFVGDEPGSLNYRRGNLRMEEGAYQQALNEFNAQLHEDPGSPTGLMGRALALMGLGRNDESLAVFGEAIRVKPDFAAAYADRGILLDRMGRPEEALRDYRKALELDRSLGDGPGWLTRFFRNQWDRPPTIADRAAYLQQELRKPPSERLLRVPEEDNKQRAYKVEGKL